MTPLTHLTPKTSIERCKTHGTNGTTQLQSTLMHCIACYHADRDEIDRQLVAGIPLRTISARFHLALGSVHRHKEHVKEIIKARTDGDREEHGGELLARVLRLAAEAEEILQSAKAASNLKAATSAICACVRVLELTGRLDGSLAQPNTPGLHLHLNKTTNINVGCDDDNELAMLIAEGTRDYDPVEIERLRRIAESQKALPACTNLAPPR